VPCLDQLSATSSFGGLSLNQLVEPSANLAPSTRDIAANDPDNLRIRGPILLEQGLDDTTVLQGWSAKAPAMTT
jgi:hypothetical protein